MSQIKRDSDELARIRSAYVRAYEDFQDAELDYHEADAALGAAEMLYEKAQEKYRRLEGQEKMKECEK